MKPTDTFAHLRRRVEEEHHTNLTGRSFTSDITNTSPYLDSMTVRTANLNNGDFIYIMVDEAATGVHEMAHSSSKKIAKDGTIIAQDYTTASQTAGFRPGMLPLRAMKKSWTLSEFIQLDEQFVFRLKASPPSLCKLAKTDSASMQDFFAHARSVDFQRMR